jgi:hypothetical protein
MLASLVRSGAASALDIGVGIVLDGLPDCFDTDTDSADRPRMGDYPGPQHLRPLA